MPAGDRDEHRRAGGQRADDPEHLRYRRLLRQLLGAVHQRAQQHDPQHHPAGGKRRFRLLAQQAEQALQHVLRRKPGQVVRLQGCDAEPFHKPPGFLRQRIDQVVRAAGLQLLAVNLRRIGLLRRGREGQQHRKQQDREEKPFQPFHPVPAPVPPISEAASSATFSNSGSDSSSIAALPASSALAAIAFSPASRQASAASWVSRHSPSALNRICPYSPAGRPRPACPAGYRTPARFC